MTDPRAAEDIQRDLEATRAHLASTVDELAQLANPKRLVEQGRQRLIGTTQGRAALGALGGLVVAYVGLKVVRRRRKKAGRKKAGRKKT